MTEGGARRPRVLVVVGTRPEAIKMAPVVRALEASAQLEGRLCITAQHREMLDAVLSLFELEAHHDLDLMTPGQDLFDVTARALTGLRDVLADEHPDCVLVHGDTTTCLAGALAGYYAGVPVGHVEAGLRSGDLARPFPEEGNRLLVDRLSRWLFAPTQGSAANLAAEGLDGPSVLVTGNTVIDALLDVRARVRARDAADFPSLRAHPVLARESGVERMVLVTGHRRESFGDGFRSICRAIARAAELHPSWTFVYPVHLNPNVRRPVAELLTPVPNVLTIEPQDYEPFVWLMDRSDLILTDSGGIQEEGPALGKPVLVMRDVTERPEAVEAGTVRLVGASEERILAGLEDVLLDPATYARMAQATSPYGDGHASERIVARLARDLCAAASGERAA